MTVIGIDIGGTKCAVCQAEPPEFVPREVARFATTEPEATLARLLEAVASAEPGPGPVVGIACGSPLDTPRGMILSPPNLPGWDGVPIVERIRESTGGRVHLMNDANAGALAEWRSGAGRGTRNMAFLTHGTGMGAGLIVEGRLAEGASGDAGEVGHVRLTDEGPEGYGKRGSMEGWTSGGGIARLARLRMIEARREQLLTIPSDAVTARDVAAAAEQGDPLARAVLAESGRMLGRGLAILVDVLNPEVIALGSLYVRARRWFEKPMRETLAAETLPHALEACRIVPAELGETLGNHAAVCVALYREGLWMGG